MILRACTKRALADHPDAAAMLALMAGRYPYWQSGWEMPPDVDTFVVLYANGRPVAGARNRGAG